MVVRALEVLLQGAGYEVRLLEELEAYKLKELLEGVDVLLLGRNLSDEHRHDFLSAMASTPEAADIRILSFSADPRGTLAENVRLVPWPCKMEDLVREIEAALRSALADGPPVTQGETPLP